jgi:lipid-binding SYLF domain-containing protein
MTHPKFPALILALTTFMLASTCTPALAATTADELNHEADQALSTLYKGNEVPKTLAKKAKAILVFPNIIKAGLVFGGSYGEGVLIHGARARTYFNSVSASFGWQAGAQSFGYAVFLMTDKAVKYLEDSQGWELGVGPTVVFVNQGVAKNLSTTSLQVDAYAVIFDQQGLMASLTIEGTKVSRISRPK